jgi:signal transduction histidine kinase
MSSQDILVVADDPARRNALAERVRRLFPLAGLTALGGDEAASSELGGTGGRVLLLDYPGEVNRVRELLALLPPRGRPARPYVLVNCRDGEAATLDELLAEGADDFVVDGCSDAEFACRLRAGRARVHAIQGAVARAEQLAELSSRQTDFLSVVSHEIRTPLAAILSAANILVRYGKQRPESVERFGRVIQEEGRRLTRLINNLLDLTKIEAGQVEWEISRFPVAELATQAQDAFAALVGERAVNLAVTVDQGVGEIVADRDKLMQVLVNLISNAIKHSPEGGTVYVRARQAGPEKIRLEIEDEGPGIPAGAEERIFERFQQLDVEDRNRGTGLGLTISRQIVARHGGHIWVEPGRRRGALFHVALPVEGLTRSGHGPVR